MKVPTLPSSVTVACRCIPVSGTSLTKTGIDYSGRNRIDQAGIDVVRDKDHAVEITDLQAKNSRGDDKILGNESGADRSYQLRPAPDRRHLGAGATRLSSILDAHFEPALKHPDPTPR